ncbi:hypothetical protein PLESTB_001093000 [Pleodorina starrii]|uniref:Uncharacterized protein n=1 Tax=Pleodorina starrii TaxID=330485 RepID=A0A9W6BQP4_9CHLO|nr:hypothetical protein PLESTM_000693600 [Pleodorina starrii]GLC56328.1 hypothetical protein PLESTB_001093000 [Pleodorina starrii]
MASNLPHQDASAGGPPAVGGNVNGNNAVTFRTGAGQQQQGQAASAAPHQPPSLPTPSPAMLVSQTLQRILSYRRSEHGGHPHLDPHHHTMGASGGGGLREAAVLMRGAAAAPLGFPHRLHAGDGGGHVLGLGMGGSGGDSDGDSGTDQAAAAGSKPRRKRRARARRDEGMEATSAGVETADPLAPPLAGLAAGGAPAPRPRHPTAWEDATAALASLDLGSARRQQGPPARKRPRVDLGGGVDGNTGS